MNTIDYLDRQLTNINRLLHEIVGDVSEEEWLSRAAPGQNRIGFITWHIARTQDTVVQTWIRTVPEVLHRPEWAHWEELRPLGMGAGIRLEEADRIAAVVRMDETFTYVDLVHQEIVTWLRQQNEDDLDQVPDSTKNLAPFPEYQATGFHAELGGMFNQPIWNLLMRPCIGHIHRHLGELQLAKTLVRAQAEMRTKA